MTKHADQRRERWGQSLVDALPDGVVVVDAQGVVRFANPAAAAMLGVAPERLVGALFGAPIADRHAVHVDLVAPGMAPRVVEMRVAPIDWDGSKARVLALRDITEATRDFERAELAATHDALTGLANRTLMAAHLEQAMRLACRDGHYVGLLYVDLDHFKDVNDRCGHETGDALLCSIAQRLTSLLRHGDGVARMGGDEFTVTLIGLTTPDYAATVAAKVLDELGRRHDLNGHELVVTASVGLAVFPDHAEDVAGLLRRADEALYRAKGHGKGRFVVWTPQWRP